MAYNVNNVTELDAFRRKRKKKFLEDNKVPLEDFFSRFVSKYFAIGFDVFNALYIQQKLQQNEMAWDYYDFREDLIEAISNVYGETIWQEINCEPWFNSRWLSFEEVIERCMRQFILAKDSFRYGVI